MSAHKILDNIDVPTIVAISIPVSLIDIELILKITFWVCSLGYLGWKWRAAYLRDKSFTKDKNKV